MFRQTTIRSIASVVIIALLVMSPVVFAETEEDKVKATTVEWDAAFNAGDVDRLGKLYAEDAITMLPNMPAIEGKKAITADFGEYLKQFTAANYVCSTDEVQILGDVAIQRGKYAFTGTLKSSGEQVKENGKFLQIKKRVGDSWKIVREITNTDHPTEE
jgi:uncharacterized protein (TIGR02246 family)